MARWLFAIRPMNEEALPQFERDLRNNHFKRRLVIDQRFQSGGGMIRSSGIRPTNIKTTRGRDSVYITRPRGRFFGPVVVMPKRAILQRRGSLSGRIQAFGLGKRWGKYQRLGDWKNGAFRLRLAPS